MAYTQGLVYEQLCGRAPPPSPPASWPPPPGGGAAAAPPPAPPRCRAVFWESTGLYGGRSSVRRVEAATGRVLAQRALPGEQFGEGLARVGARLVQLTWQSGAAWTYAAGDFEDRVAAQVRRAAQGTGCGRMQRRRELHGAAAAAPLELPCLVLVLVVAALFSSFKFQIFWFGLRRAAAAAGPPRQPRLPLTAPLPPPATPYNRRRPRWATAGGWPPTAPPSSPPTPPTSSPSWTPRLCRRCAP
jgi:hypothetical protein